VVTQTSQAAPLRDPARRGADCLVGFAGSRAQPFRSERPDATRNHDVTGGFSGCSRDHRAAPGQPPGRHRAGRM